MVISRRRFAENGKEMYRNKKSTRRACKAFVLAHYICKICGVVAAVASYILNSLLIRMLPFTNDDGNAKKNVI